MKVLMLGWEFPPYISGGLGTACYGLTKGLAELGTRVTFVVPHELKASQASHVTLLGCPSAFRATEAKADALPNVRLCGVDVRMYPYGRPGQKATPAGQDQWQTVGPKAEVEGQGPLDLFPGLPQDVSQQGDPYGGDLFRTIARYGQSVGRIAQREPFDVVHAHDWMTFAAGAVAARVSGKPLVVHVHSTEFDRNGEHVDRRIYDIERQGMHRADRVIAVSRLTQRMCVDRYGVPKEKVTVVYNAVQQVAPRLRQDVRPRNGDQVVLFLGRMTMQKGPEYFVAAAHKVLQRVPNVKFIMAGTGDLTIRTIEMAAALGIGHRVLFAGFLQGDDVARAFRMADLYVMPSVSEPFGIAPLEALAHGVPVIISKQSGVAEVLTHALKVDFWDVNELANKMIAVLMRAPLRNVLRENGASEVRKFDWTVSAGQCLDVYGALVREVN